MVRDHKITSLQVAERAGVSQSAVSRVFTPGASASSKTQEKVRKAAAELGYRPNTLARAMVSGRSRIIGLVVAYLENQFYPDALERLSNICQSDVEEGFCKETSVKKMQDGMLDAADVLVYRHPAVC